MTLTYVKIMTLSDLQVLIVAHFSLKSYFNKKSLKNNILFLL